MYRNETQEMPDVRICPVPAQTWPLYLNGMTAMMEESYRIVKLGGLSAPGVADHLQASRAVSAQAGRIPE